MAINIPVILASPNQQGNSALLAEWLLAGANSQNHNFEKIHLHNLKIASFSNANRLAPPDPNGPDQDTRPLIEKIKQADHIIIATPIWNFGLPGPLKNFLDRALVSGRVWSEKKQKKIAGWRNKKFYLLFTMGAHPLLAWPNYLAVLQLIFTLWYYGAGCRVVRCAYNCGNGQAAKISDRQNLAKTLKRQGQKLFI